jgi:glycerol uptake facilitator-like aquaporin
MLPGMTLPRRLASEAIGTALLLAAVVGSGIMGDRLAGGNAALALLAFEPATHFNPLVTLVSAWRRETRWCDVLPIVAVQVAGALVGVALANLMFGEPAFVASRHARQGSAQWLSEAVATFGLLLTILACRRHVAFAVGAYISAAYWFTASTSFANPAVTLARSLTDTFAGIRPADVPAFVAAQVVGAAAAAFLCRWLVPKESS